MERLLRSSEGTDVEVIPRNVRVLCFRLQEGLQGVLRRY